MELLIAGDLVLSNPYSVNNIDEEILRLFNQSDYNIVNLEAPITNSTSKIFKTGPNLKSDRNSTEEVLKVLQIDLVTLANNHILDYDKQGVIDTLSFCKENNIHTVGAGINLKEASKIFYLDTKEGRIAIVNFAENEWTCATKDNAGANPMDLIDNIKQLKEAKEKADFVIVIVHGGNEHYNYPSPRMVKQYRYYAENGADAVISHHTHCVSGYERHNNVPIFYSLGNFLFTMTNRPKGWYSGLVLKLIIIKGQNIDFELTPVSLSKENFELSLFNDSEKEDILKIIEEVNIAIENEEILEERWQEFVKTAEIGYLRTISPLGAIKNGKLRAILHRIGLYKLLLNEKYLKEHLNRIRCEAHYDVSKQWLINALKKRKKII